MKKILGLDLGVASIGVSLIEYDNQDRKGTILYSHVRRIPFDAKTVNEFTRGLKVSLNATRQSSRTLRRNLFRKRLRRDKLVKLLKQNGFIGKAEELKSEDRNGLWESRAKAPYEKVSLLELSRIFSVLLHRRGFKPSRAEQEPEEEPGTDYKGRIESNSAILKTRDAFIGEYIFQEMQKNPHFRVKDRIFKRGDYQREFDAIWETQAQYYPQMTPQLKKEFGERCIFYQRPLKSKKHLVGKCRFEPQRRTIPKSSPIFQEFRLWSDLNQLQVTRKDGEMIRPSLEQKRRLYSILQRKPKLTGGQILKEMGFAPRKDSLNLEKITGNILRQKLFDALSEEGTDIEKYVDADFSLKGDEFDKQPSIQLWHVLYSLPLEHIAPTLSATFGFKESTIENLISINLPDGYGALSSRAIRKILPGLWEGKTYDAACDQAGYRHADYLTNEENEKRRLADFIEEIKRNELRNPVAERVLNHLISLVNAILNDPDLGRPDEIRIELARDLKKSSAERNRISKRIAQRDKEYKSIAKEIEKLGQKPTRKNKQKYLLAEMQGWIDPYSGKTIQPSKLFNKDLFDVDHIIPQALLFDDSLSNKVVVASRENREKKEQTAFDYMKGKGEAEFEKYCLFIKDTDLPIRKKEYLLMKREEIPDDFLNRDLALTRYITSEAVKRLKTVCRSVQVTSGRVTDFLRHNWGFNELLKELNLKTFGEFDLVETKNGKPFIKDWDKRSDHRHHALDALVVAMTDQGIIQRLNTLNSREREDQYGRNSWKKIPEPWKNCRKDVKKALENTLVTSPVRNRVGTINKNEIKVSTKTHPEGKVIQRVLTPRSNFHDAFVYGMNWKKTPFPIKGFARWKKEEFEEAVFEYPDEKEALWQHLESFQGNFKRAFSTKNLPIKFKGRELETITLLTEQFVVRKKVDPTLNLDKVVDPKIRRILKDRLDNPEYEGNAKLAFANLDQNPIYLNREKGITIKRVRCFSDQKDLVPLKDKPQPSKHRLHAKPHFSYVNPRNNHHIPFFKDKKGKISFLPAVSFWDAFARKQQGESVIRTSHPEGHEFLFHLEKGDFFVFLDEENKDIDLRSTEGFQMFSQNLYRLKSISTGSSGKVLDMEFEHHFISLPRKKNGLNSLRISSAKKLEGAKVQFDRLGKVKNLIWT